MKGLYAFSLKHTYNFLHFFPMIFFLSFITCSIDFLISATVGESSLMTIADIQALSIAPEINIPNAKSVSIAFELPPQIIQE